MWQIEDLYTLEYLGDKMMGAFMFLWHKVVSCLRGEVTKEQLRKILRKELGKSAALKEDIAHYDRQGDRADSDEYNYEYLLNIVGRNRRRVGQDQIQTSFETNVLTKNRVLENKF